MGAIDVIGIEARRVLIEALMSVAWADRTLTDEELSAARGAAVGLGLVMPGDEELTANDRQPPAPEELMVDQLRERDRELIYLCAAWMALADDEEAPDEVAVLDRLKERLDLDDERAGWLHDQAGILRQSSKETGASWWRAFDMVVVKAAKALHIRATQGED